MLHTLPQAAVLAMKEDSWTWLWNTPLLPHVLTMGHNSSDTDTTINSVRSVINMYRYSVLEHWCLMHDFEYNCQAIRFEHDWLCAEVYLWILPGHAHLCMNPREGADSRLSQQGWESLITHGSPVCPFSMTGDALESYSSQGQMEWSQPLVLLAASSCCIQGTHAQSIHHHRDRACAH